MGIPGLLAEQVLAIESSSWPMTTTSAYSIEVGASSRPAK